MSSVFHEFISRQQTGWCQSRTCDICGKKVERVGVPPVTEAQGGRTMSFPNGAFEGWMSISTRLRRGGDEIEVYADVCDICRHVLMDAWLAHGFDPGQATTSTVYLDSNGKPVDDPSKLRGRPMCVWSAASKIGVRPCRRFRGHEGECSSKAEGQACPMCWDGYSETDAERPPIIYTTRALEHHAETEHMVMPIRLNPADGHVEQWVIEGYGTGHYRRPGQGEAFCSALEALTRLAG